MLLTMLMFVACNFIILTVEFTVARLLILLLITVAVLQGFKRFNQSLAIDRIAI
jgi:hypothetical protein